MSSKKPKVLLDPKLEKQKRKSRSYKSELLAIPLILVLAVICQRYLPTLSILTWLSYMLFHELGHAVIINLSGKLSIPTLYYTFSLGDQKNWILIFVLAFGLSSLASYGYKRNLLALTGICSLLLTLQLAFTFIVPKYLLNSLILYAGLGTELFGSAVMMLLFYATMPKFFKWGINRYFFLLIAALTFCDAVMLWLYTIPKEVEEIGGGNLDYSLIFGQDEAASDLKRLVRDFSWSQEDVIFIYQLSTYASIALLAIGWLYVVRNRLIGNRN